MSAESDLPPNPNPTARSADPSASVGIFDSGLGGLSVLRAVRAVLPHERLIYIADSLHAPYGKKDDDFIDDRTTAICRWLVAQGAKVLVVACNTATAQSIALVRETLAIPIVGVEPGVKPAAAVSKSRVVGVLATQVTLRSARFWSLLERYAGDCRFMLQTGHGLVQAVERCDTSSPELMALLESYLVPMLDAGADTLVLGCTHYPFLDRAIRDIAGERLQIVDTSVAIARQLDRLLDADRLKNDAPADPMPRFCSTADGKSQRQLAASLLHLDATVEHVHIPSRRTSVAESDLA